MKTAGLFLLGILILAPAGDAHDIITTKLTYTRDISRIFARRCTGCHSAASSVSLTNYAEVRPWAVAIKQEVLSRKMPPWGAVKGFGNLAPDHALTQEEVMIIAAWVIGGAPEGKAALLPKAPIPIDKTPEPPLFEALWVNTRMTLKQPLALAAIRPASTSLVASARITATLPDGHTEPLVWLMSYDPKWSRVFRFREPLLLPRGAVIQSNAPIRFVLECK